MVFSTVCTFGDVLAPECAVRCGCQLAGGKPAREATGIIRAVRTGVAEFLAFVAAGWFHVLVVGLLALADPVGDAGTVL